MLDGAESWAQLSGILSHSGTGSAVSGKVLVESDLAGWGHWSRLALVEVDKNGTFVAGSIPPGLLRVSAWARGLSASRSLTYAVHEGQTLAMRLELAPMPKVIGHLHAVAGGSLHGWRVLAKHMAMGLTFSSNCDHRGRFEINQVNPGAYDITISSRTGFEQVVREALIVRDEDIDLGSIPVQTGIKLRGHANITGPGQATLVQLRQSYPTPRAVAVESNSVVASVVQGSFEFEALLQGKYRLIVEDSNLARGTAEVIIGAAAPHEVSVPLAQKARIHGTAFDDQGEPLLDGFVVIEEVPRLANAARPGGTDHSTTLDVVSRRVRIKTDGSFVVGGLTGGAYRLHVLDRFGRQVSRWEQPQSQSSGTEDANTPTERPFTEVILADNLDSVDVALRGDSCRRTINAMLRRADGTPIGGAQVHVTRVGDAGSGGLKGTSDSTGWVQFAGLCEGDYQARAYSRGPPFLSGQSKIFRTADQLISIQLMASSGIRLHVAKDSQVIRKYVVALDGSSPPRLERIDGEGERTTIDWLAPGLIGVTVLAHEGWYSGELDVRAGELTDWSIKLSEWRTIRGQLISPLGVPLANATVVWLPERPLTENFAWAIAQDLGERARRARTNPQGHFELRHVYSDRIHIGFSTSDGAILASEMKSSTFDGTVWANTTWPLVEIQAPPFLDLGRLIVTRH